MGKGTTTTCEFVASRRNLNVESTSLDGKDSSSGRSGLKVGNKKIRLRVLEKKRGLVDVKRRITTTMSDLHEDLVAEILSRIPMTSLKSVRYTCKQWNTLSRNQIFGKPSEANNQFLGFMVEDFRIYSLRIDLQGIRKNVEDFIDLYSKQVSLLNQIKVDTAYHYDGLILCTPIDDTLRLLVWNPYLSQMRWIQHKFSPLDTFVLGYDNNGNHKILQLLDFYYGDPLSGFKIYEFSSNSWKVLDAITPKWKIPIYTHGVTLKGNAYFYAQEDVIVEGAFVKMEHFLLCFDFTSERFGPRLSLPFRCATVLSCVGDKQLAVLYQPRTRLEKLEIWVTDKIDYNEVLWTKWMQVDMNLLTVFPFCGSFFIDEVKKFAVIFNPHKKETCYNQTAYIVGQDGCLKSIDIGASPAYVKSVVFGYFPSLVKIE